jgi:hypothetical protein
LALYNDFRTKEYDPNSQVVPDGQTARRSRPLATGARLFDQCADYKPFKDEAYWIRYSRLCSRSSLDSNISSTLTTSSGLGSTPTLRLYKILQDIMQAPAKAIVVRHLKDKDTRTLWRILAHYDNSMTAQLTKISNYLCSVRLHNINWRGTQANFVINFAVALWKHLPNPTSQQRFSSYKPPCLELKSFLPLR